MEEKSYLYIDDFIVYIQVMGSQRILLSNLCGQLMGLWMVEHMSTYQGLGSLQAMKLPIALVALLYVE